MNKRPLHPHTKRYSEQATKVFKGVRFDVYRWQQEQFDSSMATYEIVKRNDTVIVIPVIGEEVIIVNEKQPHWDNEAMTLIAGIVNPEEDLKDAAKRIRRRNGNGF